MSRLLDWPSKLAVPVQNVWAAAKARPLWRKPLSPVLIAGMIGFALSGAASFLIAHYLDAHTIQAELNLLGDNRRLVLQNELTNLEQMILTVAHRFDTPDQEMARPEFNRIVNQSRDVFSPIFEIDWAPRVRRRWRSLHEIKATREGLAGYHISMLDPDGKPIPAPEQDEYFPVYYAQNTIEMPLTYGVDMGSVPAQREAMERSDDSGRIAATPPVESFTSSGLQSAVYVFVAIYVFDSPHEKVEDRRRNLRGFIRGAFLPSTLIDRILSKVKPPRGLDIYFFQQGAGQDARPFHVRSSLLRSAPAGVRFRAGLEAGLHWTGEVTLADTRWTMIVVPVPGGSPLINHERARTALGTGLLLTVAFMIYMDFSRRHTLRLLKVMTELRESDEKFRALGENAQDAIIMFDGEGKVSYWNKAAERIFGYAPDEILGANAHSILAPERYREKAFAGYVRFAATGKGDLLGKTYEFEGLRKDGSEFPIELSVSGFHNSNCWNAIGIVRDITERKSAAVAIAYRNELLRAISIASSHLLTASILEEALPKVLEIVGKAARVDRVLLFEVPRSLRAEPVLSLRCRWQSADAPVVLDVASFTKAARSAFEADHWFAPLRELKAVTRLPRTMNSGAAKTHFESLGILSILVVPMAVDGKYWGQIGFDDCKTEREWDAIEIDALRTLADMIASSFTREHYIKELMDAKSIVERSPTMLYRLGGEPSLPMIYTSDNISLLGYDPAEMIAAPQLYMTLVHPDDQVKVREALGQTLLAGSQPVTIEFRVRKRDGSYRWFEDNSRPIRDAAGRLIEIEGVMTDITERREAEQNIALLARTDSLTGLANRATFIERLYQVFAAARRGASPFAVLYIDLDHFKEVNDTLGHSAGDLLLKSAAGHLKRSCRESDLVARLGGDEFAILQTEVSDVSGTTALASKIHCVLGTPYQLGDSKLFLSASIGISFYTDETAGPDEMLAKADLALYRAKEEGRDQYRFHSDELDQEMRERVTLTGDLRQALEKNELELYYQPQVELFTGRIAGMEALIRWNHPKRGLLMPADFIPIMEKTDAIVALGQWVLDHACEQMSSWRNAGIAPVILAVNLSLGQLRTGDELIQFVTTTLTKWGLTPKDLEVDVTESMLAYTTWAYNDVLEQLQQLGVTIAIDDFGTQYSSLDYLKHYHVSRVKIPRAMITAATQQDQENAAMVRAIIGFARELNIEVMAQGVENEAQRDLLTAAPSTTKVQGFYYSAPVPASGAEQLLRQRLIEPGLSQVSEATAAQ
ncbi:MAG: EAL domain-containing protein [Methylocella sp.]